MTYEGFGESAEKLRRSTVQLIVDGGSRGSGVIWNSDGLIVTNAHVLQGRRAKVELWDGRSLDGQITSRDDRRDLASVRIPANALPAATSRDSDSVQPGELALAVGNPLGFIGALTTGVVHARGPVPGLGARWWVQAAIRLAPGNSGGPLADAQGKVIGLNTMVVSGGLALAIPSNVVNQFLREGGSRARLGVAVRPLRLDRATIGLMILEIAPGGPAERASLLPGDILIGANGIAFRSFDDLSEVIERARGAVRLLFLRGGQKVWREVAVQLDRAAAEAA